MAGASGIVHAADYTVSDVFNGSFQLRNGDTLTITDTGSIFKQGDNSYGVESYLGSVGNLTVFNYGSVQYTGNSGSAIWLQSGNNTVVNWGSVTAKGEGVEGIELWGGDNTAINFGSIYGTGVAGVSGVGISATVGGNNTVTNWGSIVTDGTFGDGIRTSDGGNSVTNWGDILVLGNFSEGISASHGGNNIANWGTIHVTGKSSYGISFNGAGNSATNSGKIVSERSYAIKFSAGNSTGGTLNLLAPGYLGGGIHLGRGTAVNVTTGPSNSVLWSFEGPMDGGVPTVTGPYAGFYNADTQEFATFEPTALAGTVNQFGHMQGLLSSVGRSGLDRGESAHVQVADSSGETASDGGGILPWDGRVWAGVFGGVYDHDGDDATLDRDIDLKGFAAGYSARPMAGLTVAAMAGYLRGSQDADAKYAPSYRLDSTGIFAGANGRMAFGLFDLDVGLTGGRVSYDSDRFINDNLAPSGASWATASFDGWFVIPEVGVSTAVEWTGIITVRPSARVSYAYQRIGSYQESGSRADASVDGRTLSLLTGTAELAFEKQLFDMVTVNAVGGYEKRLNVGDDAVSMQLINVTNEVEIGDTDSAALYAGGGLSVDIGDHVNLAVEARTYLNGDFNGAEGHARVSIAF